jgi:hypothetical protein
MLQQFFKHRASTCTVIAVQALLLLIHCSVRSEDSIITVHHMVVYMHQQGKHKGVNGTSKHTTTATAAAAASKAKPRKKKQPKEFDDEFTDGSGESSSDSELGFAEELADNSGADNDEDDDLWDG